VYHSLQINPRTITITHFSKVGLRAVFFSYKNMDAIVITCSNSKLSPVSFMLNACWLYDKLFMATYAVCWTFFSTSTNMYMFGYFTFQFSVQQTTISLSAIVGIMVWGIAPDTSGGWAHSQRGWEFRIHINVVFKNVVCELHSNVRRGSVWHDVDSESIWNFMDDHSLRMTAVSLSYASYIFVHLTLNKYEQVLCVFVQLCRAFPYIFFLRFCKVSFCAFMTFLNWCVAFS